MLRYCWIILCLVFALPVQAENDDLFSLSMEELMEIVVSTTSRYQEMVLDSPGNITVFTREEIQRRGFRSIEDILRTMPGVDMQKFAVFSPSMVIALRGAAGNNKFLVLQDGVRISSASGERTDISHNFPIYYAKQVEVLLGAAAVSYGADAALGVINIISMDQDNDDSFQLQTDVGTDDYRHGSAYLNYRFNNGLHLSMGIHGFDSQQYQFAEDFPEYYPPGELSPTDNPFEFPQDEVESFYARLQTPEHWDFGINHSRIRSLTYDSSRPDKSAFDTNAVQQDLLTTVYGRYSSDITANLHSVTLVSLLNYEQDNDTNFNLIFTNFVPEYKYANTDRVSVNQDFTWQINEEHLLSAGLVYDYIDSIPVGANLPSRYDESRSPADQGLLYPGTGLPLVLFEYTHENVGLYFQDNWKLDEQWRLVGGIRYDHDSSYGSTLNPRLAAIYHNNNNIIKLIYGHSFLAPAPDLAFRNFGGFDGLNNETELWDSSFFRAPNPDLKPEKLRTLEFTFEHGLNQHTRIKLAPYFINIDDAISISKDDTPNQFIPGAFLSFTESNKNAGKLAIYGIDASIENEHGDEGDDFSIRSWAAVSYVDGRIKDAGITSELPFISNYKFKGGSSITYRDKLTLTTQVYWIGTAHNNEKSDNDPGRRLHASGYFVVDMQGEAKISERLSIKAGVYNLFDSKYTNAQLEPTSLALPEAPQPGRLVTVGFDYRF